MSRCSLALLLLVLGGGGCTERTDLLAATDAGRCSGPGAPIVLGEKAPCSGALASQLLRYALCSCTALVLDRGLYTEGGSGPPPMRGPLLAPPAAVGTDDYFQVAGPLQVAGTLEVGGSDGAGFSHTAGVLGNLRSAGTVRANEFLTVGGDAFVDGDLLGRVDIAGDLQVPDGATLASSVTAGNITTADVEVAPPCDCAAGPALDIPKLVAARASSNDNTSIRLSPDALNGGDASAGLDLPCGQFYLSAIAVADDMELQVRVHGRAALFVGGDVSLGQGLRVSLDPGAEFDLIVSGDLSVQGGTVGAQMTESVRLWLGSSTVKLADGADLSAAIYAPQAVVISDGDLSVRGALLAQGVAASGDVSIHFDPDILNAGDSCGAPSQSAVQ